MNRPRHEHCVICGVAMTGEHSPLGWYVNTAFCSWTCRDKANRVKAAAHKITTAARLMGLLPAASTLLCADCGEQAKFYDHRDYSKPLVVQPVCHSCNILRGPGLYPQCAGLAA